MARIGSGRHVRWRAGDVVEALLGAITSTPDRLQARRGERARGQQRERAVDALQALDVDRQRIEKDVRQRMARDLRQVRVFAAARPLARRLVHAAGPDDQDALAAEVNRRRDRRGLAHRAVAAVLGVAIDLECHRREHERDRRRGQQMLHADCGAHRDALRARPRHDVRNRVVEGHVQARAVARRADRERLKMLRP